MKYNWYSISVYIIHCAPYSANSCVGYCYHSRNSSRCFSIVVFLLQFLERIPAHSWCLRCLLKKLIQREPTESTDCKRWVVHSLHMVLTQSGFAFGHSKRLSWAEWRKPMRTLNCLQCVWGKLSFDLSSFMSDEYPIQRTLGAQTYVQYEQEKSGLYRMALEKVGYILYDEACDAMTTRLYQSLMMMTSRGESREGHLLHRKLNSILSLVRSESTANLDSSATTSTLKMKKGFFERTRVKETHWERWSRVCSIPTARKRWKSVTMLMGRKMPGALAAGTCVDIIHRTALS